MPAQVDAPAPPGAAPASDIRAALGRRPIVNVSGTMTALVARWLAEEIERARTATAPLATPLSERRRRIAALFAWPD